MTSSIASDFNVVRMNPKDASPRVRRAFEQLRDAVGNIIDGTIIIENNDPGGGPPGGLMRIEHTSLSSHLQDTEVVIFDDDSSASDHLDPCSLWRADNGGGADHGGAGALMIYINASPTYNMVLYPNAPTGDLIDGSSSTITLAPGDRKRLISDGENWFTY